MERETTRVQQELQTSVIALRIREISEQLTLIKNAKTLVEIGITPIDAIKILESHGIEPVLSESDKCEFEHPRGYSSKSSLIGVHKTKYIPNANIIKSASDAKAECQKSVVIDGVRYEYSFESARNTVHMAMNDEVSSHLYGSWDDCKYAILIPFEDIPDEKIARAAPMDTFTRGSVELSENTWILCPKSEVERLKMLNPKVHVLGYEGQNVQGYSKPFLTQLGFRGEDVGMWSWGDEKSTQQFYELMDRCGIKKGTHSYTYFHEDEQILTSINQVIALSKLLRDNNLLSNPEKIESVMSQLEEVGQGYGNILSELCMRSIITDDIEPQSVKANNRQVDVLFEEMEKNGFSISQVYQEVLKRLSKISIHDCNKDNVDMVFFIPENASEEEKRIIEEMRDGFDFDGYESDLMKKSAFSKFISTIICDSIIHSKEKMVSKEVLENEK